MITTNMGKNEFHSLNIDATPIGYITCEQNAGNATTMKTARLYFAAIYNNPYFLMKEEENGNAYIVETGSFAINGTDYNARCRINDSDYRMSIPGNILKMIEPRPAKVLPDSVIVKEH